MTWDGTVAASTAATTTDDTVVDSASTINNNATAGSSTASADEHQHYSNTASPSTASGTSTKSGGNVATSLQTAGASTVDRRSEPDPDSVKMFVGQIPRHWKEDDCRRLLEDFGPVYSLSVLRDKQTGVSKGCCFVTFYTRVAAELAQNSLHGRRTLDGMSAPIQLKPADQENRNERKLFVGQISRRWAEDDVRTLFESFGTLEEVSILRDNDGHSKSCAFVTFTSKANAQRAADAMHESQTCEGCSKPIQVRFADTQKDKEAKKVQSTSPGAAVAAVNTPHLDLGHLLGKSAQQLGGLLGAAPAAIGTSGAAASNLLSVLGNVLTQLGRLTDEQQQSSSSSSSSMSAQQHSASAKRKHSDVGEHRPSSNRQPTDDQQQQQEQSGLYQQQMLALQQQQQLQLQLLQQQHQHTPYTASFNGQTAAAAGLLGYQAQTQQQPLTAYHAQFAAPPTQSVIYNASAALGKTTGLPGPSTSSIDIYQQQLQLLNGGALAAAVGAAQQTAAIGNGHTKGPDGANLFIYHLPQDFGDSDLVSTFQPFGTILSAKVFIDKQTNLSKCFGFVSYDAPASAARAIQAMNGFQIGTKRLKVQLKTARPAGKPY